MLESDLLEEVMVSLTIKDEIGMPDSDLEVAWVYLRDNQPVAGTEDTGAIGLLLIEEGSQMSKENLTFHQILKGSRLKMETESCSG